MDEKKPEPTDSIVRTLIQGLRNEIDRKELTKVIDKFKP